MNCALRGVAAVGLLKSTWALGRKKTPIGH